MSFPLHLQTQGAESSRLLNFTKFAGAGALAGRLVCVAPLAQCALYSAAFLLSTSYIAKGMDRLFGSTPLHQIVHVACAFFSSIVIAFSLTSLVGCSITLLGAVATSALIYPAAFISHIMIQTFTDPAKAAIPAKNFMEVLGQLHSRIANMHV